MFALVQSVSKGLKNICPRSIMPVRKSTNVVCSIHILPLQYDVHINFLLRSTSTGLIQVL